MVWEHVAADPRQAWGYNLNGGGYKKRLTPYARVCRGWDEFFASKTFRKLTVNQRDFGALRALLPGHRKFVKHIWLRVLLDNYECDECNVEEDAVWHGRNTAVTERAIADFFGIIYNWDLGGFYGCPAPTDAMLEISIHSPSDKLHYFRSYDFNVTPVTEADEFAPLTSNSLGPVPTSPQVVAHVDTPHRRIGYGEIGAIRRLFGRSALDVRFRIPLPPIDFITRFVVRRQTRRRLNALGMCCILSALPNLQGVSVELWREWTTFDQQIPIMVRHERILLHGLSTSLKSLTVFEDSNDDFTSVVEEESLQFGLSDMESFRTPNSAIAVALAELSLKLEHVAVAFMVDASEFLAACQPDWVWRELRSLSLTCVMLGGTEPGAVRLELLEHVSLVVQNMPKLKTMELWEGGHEYAILFRYEVDDDRATLTWKSTPKIDLEEDIIEAWKTTALNYSRKGLTVVQESLDGARITSHASAISKLGLKVPILSAGALEQMEIEASLGLLL